MAKLNYDSAVRRLKESPTNFSCAELKSLLVDLGFVVKRGRSGNHHTFSHPKLDDFYGSDFDCGHKAKMLSVYPIKVLKTLRNFEFELKELEKPCPK